MLDYDLYVTVTVCCSGKWWIHDGVFMLWGRCLCLPRLGSSLRDIYVVNTVSHYYRQVLVGSLLLVISYYHYICICIIICKSCFVQLPVIVLVGLLLFIVYYYL